jgi:hypothetical protein
VTLAVLTLTPFVALGACLVVHVILARALPGLARPLGILLSVGAAAVGVVGLALFGPAGRLPAAVSPLELAAVWLLTYVLLAYCYVIGFFNLGESARRIRLLIDLHQAGRRGLTLDEILSTYNARMIVDVRLHRMIRGGQVRQQDGVYYTRSRVMLAAARLLVWLKIAYLGSPGEVGVPTPSTRPAPR